MASDGSLGAAHATRFATFDQLLLWRDLRHRVRYRRELKARNYLRRTVTDILTHRDADVLSGSEATMESPSPRSRHPRNSSVQRAPLLSGRESWSVDTSLALRQVSSTKAQKTTLSTNAALEHFGRASTPDLSLLGSRTARTREAKHFSSNPSGSDRLYTSPSVDESRAQIAEAHARRRREREATRPQVGAIGTPQAGIDVMDSGQFLAILDQVFARAIPNEQAVENLLCVPAEEFRRPVRIPRPTHFPMPVHNTLPVRLVGEPVDLINVHYTISEDRCGDEESVMAQRLAALGGRHKQTVFSEPPGSFNDPTDRQTTAQDIGFGIEPSKGPEPDWVMDHWKLAPICADFVAGVVGPITAKPRSRCKLSRKYKKAGQFSSPTYTAAV